MINTPICVHPFKKLCTIRFSPLSAYTSTSTANILEDVCAKNKEIKKRKHNLMLVRSEESDLSERH